MICSIDGKFYIRDLGIVHTTRLRLDNKLEVQIQKGMTIDFGKVVHYLFDKAVHTQEPTQDETDNFLIIMKSKNYDVDNEDDPHLRAKHTWLSSDENVGDIQNEILIYADGSKNVKSIGRSVKSDIQIKVKAISAMHC